MDLTTATKRTALVLAGYRFKVAIADTILTKLEKKRHTDYLMYMDGHFYESVVFGEPTDGRVFTSVGSPIVAKDGYRSISADKVPDAWVEFFYKFLQE